MLQQTVHIVTTGLYKVKYTNILFTSSRDAASNFNDLVILEARQCFWYFPFRNVTCQMCKIPTLENADLCNVTLIYTYIYLFIYTQEPGVAWWQRHFTSSRKVPESIPCGVTGDFFLWHPTIPCARG
jgi:hypothetical protein